MAWVQPEECFFAYEDGASQYIANEIDAFIASISEKQSSVPTGQDGLNALLIANAALASAKSGRGVEIGG